MQIIIYSYIYLCTNAVKYLRVHPSDRIGAPICLDRETIWIGKDNTAMSLDREEVFYLEHDRYQVAHIVRGEKCLSNQDGLFFC